MRRTYRSTAEAAEPPALTVASPLGDVLGAVARSIVAGAGLALVGLSLCLLWQAPAWYWLAALVAGLVLSGALAMLYGTRDAAALVVLEYELRQARADIEQRDEWIVSLERQRQVERLVNVPRPPVTSAWVEPRAATDPVEVDARELLERHSAGLPSGKRAMMQLGWTEQRHRAAVRVLRQRGLFSGNNWRDLSAADALAQFEGGR